MITVFFHNMTMIITLMFFYTRFDHFIQRRFHKLVYYAWVVAIMSLLSILTMIYPFKLDGMIFDLRDVPLLLVSYVLGWRIGLASMILPAIFRWYIAGPTAWHGILVMIVIPVIIGALFSKKSQLNNPIKLAKLFVAFVAYSLIKLVLLKILISMQYSDWVAINLNHIMFSSISLICMVLMLNDAHKSRHLKSRLEFMSSHDSLTGLLNLYHFKEEVNNIFEYTNSAAIAMIDIDYFKEYNDKYGHPAGDRVLEEFAFLLKENTRQGDVVARYGGEEFIICFTNIGQIEHVRLSLERLREVVEKHSFKGPETQPAGKITVSIGFSFSNGNKSIDLLIQEADQALYNSKGTGRNLVSIY